MAGPAPKELQQFCTGCTQHLRIVAPYGILSVPVPTGVNSLLVNNISITGSGRGAFSAVSGFFIGNMSVISPNSLTGNCTAVTGSLTFTGSTGATGLTGWSASSITGCTGTSPCNNSLNISFRANPNIWNLAPNANILVHVEDYNYGHVSWLTVLTSGNQNFSGSITSNMPINCGSSASVNLKYDIRVPGYSGSVGNNVWVEAICKPCLLG